MTRTSVIVRGERAIRSIGMPPVTVQLTARRVDEVVRDGSGRPVRDPAHRVGDVTVEAGEEAEPVFAGQVLAAVLARPRHRKAPRLAAGNRKELVDLDVEVALDQLVGGAEARDAAAEDDDLGTHGSNHSPPSCDGLASCCTFFNRSFAAATFCFAASTLSFAAALAEAASDEEAYPPASSADFVGSAGSVFGY